MKRSNLLSEEFLQLFHNLAVADFVVVHAGHKDHAGQIAFFAQVPCLLRTYLHAVLGGNDDDGGVRSRYSFFHFADKIKISRGIENIDFVLFPLYRNNGSGDGELSLLLFTVKITDGCSVRYVSHAACHSGKISHRLADHLMN